jgi:uncharacterized protein
MIDLAPAHRSLLLDIFQQHAPSATLYAFGSRANGLAKPHSDLDILLDVKGAMPMLQRACLRMALEDSDLPMRVDWHVLQEVPEYLQKQALAENIISASG